LVRSYGEKGRGEGGFSLLEVVIAIAILSIGFLAVAHLYATTAKGHADAARIEEATKLARAMLDNMNQTPGFYDTVEGKCGTAFFKLDNKNHTIVQNAVLDPDALGGGEADPLCPVAAQKDDLDLDAVLSSGKTELEAAQSADRCLKRDIGPNAPCAPVDPIMDFDAGSLSMYWIAWNLRASYPSQKMTSVRLYVFWRGMDGKRHWVKSNALLTAKDMTFYQ